MVQICNEQAKSDDSEKKLNKTNFHEYVAHVGPASITIYSAQSSHLESLMLLCWPTCKY